MYNIVDESVEQASNNGVTPSLRVVRYLSDRGPVKRPSIFSLCWNKVCCGTYNKIVASATIVVRGFTEG